MRTFNRLPDQIDWGEDTAHGARSGWCSKWARQLLYGDRQDLEC